MAPENIMRNPQRRTQRPYLVLEQFSQGLQNPALPLQLQNPIHPVMMRLDLARNIAGTRRTLNDIGIKRALRK